MCVFCIVAMLVDRTSSFVMPYVLKHGNLSKGGKVAMRWLQPEIEPQTVYSMYRHLTNSTIMISKVQVEFGQRLLSHHHTTFPPF